MNDLFEQELRLGDYVGFKNTSSRYNYMFQGEVVGFTPKMVRVKVIGPKGVSTPIGEVMLKDPGSLTKAWRQK